MEASEAPVLEFSRRPCAGHGDIFLITNFRMYADSGSSSNPSNDDWPEPSHKKRRVMRKSRKYVGMGDLNESDMSDVSSVHSYHD